MDWVFLIVGGFLLGVFFYCGYYTTRYEPDVRHGYEVVGVGILLAVGLNTWIDFSRHIKDWYRGLTLISYAIVAIGLGLIVHSRRSRK